MRLFDRVERENLDRRELQLLVLAIGCILLLAAGLALLAYPVIFSHSFVLAGWTLKVYFFGFCGLCILLVGYLWERYRVVRGLRQQIGYELRRYAEFRQQAGRDLLAALPRFNQFQDRLVMEHRRASNLAEPFSVLVIKLTPAIDLSDQGEITAAFGDAARAVTGKLRREDSLYQFCPDAYGAILPGMGPDDARSVAGRLDEGLRDAEGAANRFSAIVKVFNYPQHGSTAHELEEAVRSVLPPDLVSEPTLEGAPAATVPAEK